MPASLPKRGKRVSDQDSMQSSGTNGKCEKALLASGRMVVVVVVGALVEQNHELTAPQKADQLR